jgi:hypothetical protein
MAARMLEAEVWLMALAFRNLTITPGRSRFGVAD